MKLPEPNTLVIAGIAEIFGLGLVTDISPEMALVAVEHPPETST